MQLQRRSGVVTSVSATDATLTISPTTGAVLAGINLINPNGWSATQSFPTTDAQGSAIDASINAATTTLINGTKISGNISGNAGGLSSTLAVASGGTGLTSYSIGDLLVATGTTTLASLPDVAAGSVLLSGGLNTAPTWGQVPVADISATGTASNTTYLRGDGAWSTIPAGFSNPMTTNGDIIYQSGGVPTELHSTNTVGQVLTVSSTNGGLAWQGVVNSIQGTGNEVLVNTTSGSNISGAGIILSTPQPISMNASPTFQALTLGDATHAGIIALSNTGSPTYTTLEASASGASQTYTLPTGYPISANEMLVSTTGGVMSWAPQNAGTVTGIGVTTANGVSGSSSGGATPSLTITLGAITPSSVVSTGAVSGTTVTATTAASGMTIGSGVNATNLSSASTVAAKNINFPNASGNLALVAGANGAIAESDVTGLTADLASKGSGTVTAIGVTTANGVSGSSSGGATPSLTITLGAITPSSVVSTGAVSGTTVTATTAASGMTIGSGVNATNLSSASTVAAKNINFPNASGNLALVAGANGAIAESDVTGLTADLGAKQGAFSGLTTDGVVYATSATAVTTTLASTVAGQFLQTTTSGAAPTWATTLGIGNGGTGSTTQNFVDLTTAQASIGGAKTFTSLLTGSAGATINGATNINNTATGSTTNINATAGAGATSIGNATNAGTINNMTVGVTTAAAGNFTTIGVTSQGTGKFTTLTATTNASGLVLGNGTLSGPTATQSYTLPNASGILSATTSAGATLFTGPTTALTFTLPNAAATILTTNAAVTPAQGGTGTGTPPSANGQLLIGASAGTYTPATLTQGAGILITNGAGTISIAATGAAPRSVQSPAERIPAALR